MDERAGAQIVSFVVAGAIFLGALVALLSSIPQASDSSDLPSVIQQAEAESLVTTLVETPGVGWEAGPDRIQRLGLAHQNGSGLDPGNLEALKGASLEMTENGKVDYEEARRSLGLANQDADFHLSIHPVGLTQILANMPLDDVRVAYVADWESLPAARLPRGTPDQDLVAAANTRFNLTAGPSTALERQALSRIGFAFNDTIYMGPSSPVATADKPPETSILQVLGVPFLDGDVYPDRKQHLDAVLAGRLHLYDVIVIGSGVDHNTLTANAVKEGFRDWVLRGGHLLVLGSSLQGYQWLQPLFSTGVTSVNHLAVDADPNHPVLNLPHELAWQSYESHDRGWVLADQEESFNHVVEHGGEDVLAVSKDGAFGMGRIILTTYLPREIAAKQGITEASNFFHNIALFAERNHLHLEYGPPLKGTQERAVTVRDSWLPDPTLGMVPVRVELIYTV